MMMPRISGLANLDTQEVNDRINKMEAIFKRIFFDVILKNHASGNIGHDQRKCKVNRQLFTRFFYQEDLKRNCDDK